MANLRAGNVIKVDTSATFSDVQQVRSIKYIGAASGTAVIKKENTSGTQIWEEAGTANLYNPDVCIRCPKGIRVEVANSAVVYLYLG